MFFNAEATIFNRAKILRNRQTGSEMQIWGYLRTRPLGFKFRRQHPLGIFIADFYCHSAALIIEVDGNIHDSPEVKSADERRQKLIENDGLQVLRFTNKQINFHFEECIASIENVLSQRKNQTPPSGGWGV